MKRTHIHTQREREKKSIKFKVGREGLMIHLNKKYLKKKRKKKKEKKEEKEKKNLSVLLSFLCLRKLKKKKLTKIPYYHIQ